MEIKLQRFISQDEVISCLYKTRSLHNPDDRPYEGADISFVQHAPDEVQPTQLYVIRENINLQHQLRNYFIDRHDEDILNMEYGGIEINVDGKTEILLPPIAEDSAQLNESLLLDGTHRTLLSISLGREAVKYIHVRNIDGEFDIAHRRLPNKWSEVTEFPTLDAYLAARAVGFVHRRAGNGDENKTYRDFSALIGKGKCTRV